MDAVILSSQPAVDQQQPVVVRPMNQHVASGSGHYGKIVVQRGKANARLTVNGAAPQSHDARSDADKLPEHLPAIHDISLAGFQAASSGSRLVPASAQWLTGAAKKPQWSLSQP
jgi:hypothetical protein